MTREQAINVFRSTVPIESNEEYAKNITEAIDMAIEALHHVEAEEKGYCHRIIPSNIEVVVRCKDCRYFKKIAERSDSGLCHRDIVASAWKENGYCSRGERKGGDTE